ncbi:DUF5060 domain-containing protein [Flavilitoribacter nigricans]|uniref:DUF5060 domain-containing protein n=1 Tax=Flavilitoribacter nigricans (strain ATCC 23147 / DSM 23189 / NBRC 102662 / NCIMB 1420 / SS-2) TaxID=1122177 RepID=A0A2D0NJQ2_FLAN2|nr:DUF5060 domain-containing protein [Flavilitoribacter nigricans]PHN08620.1 hypothetical protein CRP01_01525 [Flavilitoribacter nigricans DSM 23189 = NBRC 102662]
MKKIAILLSLGFLILVSCQPEPGVMISGELKQWHKVTLTLDGPEAHELDTLPNPFTDYTMLVTFSHESGDLEYQVPGYFAADGNAAESSAESGDQWRAHLAPDRTGQWTYQIDLLLNGEPTKWSGLNGTFEIGPSDKSGRDLRGQGRLEYVGKRYLRFAGTGDYFLKAGADAPESLLAYADFDGTYSAKEAGVKREGEAVTSNLKTWSPHVQDWQAGDPSWQNGKGKGLIGAVNYLSGTGANVFSFLTYNAGGDGDNVWPHVSREDKLHLDCSKLDQWGILFDHATERGMYLHFKLQETENDDRNGPNEDSENQALDGGDLGPERKLYLRELIARYGYLLALNWNLGEENTQTTAQVQDMAAFIRNTDPYDHPVVLHSYPNQQEKVYGPLLGKDKVLHGLSIQNSDVSDTHREAVNWVQRSEAAGYPWVVAHDESGNAITGTPPDDDYPGMEAARQEIESGEQKIKLPTVDEIRSEVLWGNLMGGGAGVEYYFGYRLPQNDLNAEDWRSRAKTWSYSNLALEFFRDQDIPFWEMENTDELVGNPDHGNSAYCFSRSGEVYVVYVAKTSQGSVLLDLSEATGNFKVQWFNPRTGDELQTGSLTSVAGGESVELGDPPGTDGQDWVILLRKE